MKKLIMTLSMAFGLAFAFGSDSNDTKERVVELSKIDWERVKAGMNASNHYHFVEQKVTLVITNKVGELFPMVLPPYRPIGRGAERRIEPPDYMK